MEIEYLATPSQEALEDLRRSTAKVMVEGLRLAYEAGLRRGWSAHFKMEPVFPDTEFEKWLAKRAAIGVPLPRVP